MRFLWLLACQGLLVTAKLILPEIPNELCYTKSMTQDVCVCRTGKIVCKCDENYPLLNITRLSRHGGKVEISDCLTILQSGAFKGSSGLHTLIFNHTRLVLLQDSLNFSTSKPLLNILINNSYIDHIPPRAISGDVRNFKLLNSIVGTISSNAFIDLSKTDSFEINRSNVSRVEERGLRNIAIETFEILDSNFDYLAPNSFSINVKQFAKLKGNSFSEVSSKGLIFGSPSKYLTIKNNRFVNASSGFIVAATGKTVEVDVERNTFVYLSHNPFEALQSEQLSFTDNTIFSAEPGSLALFFKSAAYKYADNHFNVVCSCQKLPWLKQLAFPEKYDNDFLNDETVFKNIKTKSSCYDGDLVTTFMDYSLHFCQGLTKLPSVTNFSSASESTVSEIPTTTEAFDVQTNSSMINSEKLTNESSDSTALPNVSPGMKQNSSILVDSIFNSTNPIVLPSSDQFIEELSGNFSNITLPGGNLSASTLVIKSYSLPSGDYATLSSVSYSTTTTVSPMYYVIPTIFMLIFSIGIVALIFYRRHRNSRMKSRIGSEGGTQADKSWVFAVPDTRIYRQTRVEYVVKELETVTEHIDRPDPNNEIIYGSNRSFKQSSQFHEPNVRQSIHSQDANTNESSQMPDTNTEQSNRFHESSTRQPNQFQDLNSFRPSNKPQDHITRDFNDLMDL